MRTKQIPPPADRVILPGTKSVRPNFQWLVDQRWGPYLLRHLRYGGKVKKTAKKGFVVGWGLPCLLETSPTLIKNMITLSTYLLAGFEIARRLIRVNSVLFLIILPLVSAPLNAALIKGPVTGTVILLDRDVNIGKKPIDNLVAQIRCRSYGFHGTHSAGRSQKIITSGKAFSIGWAWQGISPAGCSLYIYHPEYIMAYRSLGKSFKNDLGEIELMSWRQFLENGPTDPPMHSAYPWPKMEYFQHLRNLSNYYISAFPEQEYKNLHSFIPYLHQLTDDVLKTGVYGKVPRSDSYSPYKRIREIETKLDYPGALDKLNAAVDDNRADKAAAILKVGVWQNAIDQSGRTPLFYAAGQGRIEIVELLIQQRHNVNYSGPDGFPSNPLQAALSKNHDETVALLVHHGADWQTLPPFYWRRLASALYRLSYDGNVGAMKQLLDAGLSPDISGDSSGITPIMAAAKNNQLEAAKLLIKFGADINVHASHNRYALRIAEGKRNDAMIELLKSHGATHRIK